MSQIVASGFIDLETLGKWDNSIILSMGVTILKDDQVLPKNLNDAYDVLLSKYSAEFKFDYKSQVPMGRATEAGVIDWWRQQGEEAKAVLTPRADDLMISNLFTLWGDFIKAHGLGWNNIRWFDRNSFDFSKLQHLHEVTLNAGQAPWKYTEVWEIATFLKFCNLRGSRYGDIDPKTFDHPNFIYHSAKCDTALDALRLYRTFHP